MRVLCISICLMLVVGCGPKREVRPAQAATEAGNWDEAYRLWSNLLERYPNDTKFRLAAERARLNAALTHLRKAEYYFERDKLDEAEFETRLVKSFDPSNQKADTLMTLIQEAREAIAAEEARLADEAEAVGDSLPTLKPKTWAPLNLTFVNQSARDIYVSLGKAYGINIVVDSQIRDTKMSIDLRNMDFLKALDTLMVLNRHFFKVVDDNTLIILEDQKKNRDRYDSQIVQTFYLSNVTPKDLKAHLRNLGNIKEFAENERLNAITIKGTPEQLALAQKIINDNDKAQPEVVVEIELLEVNKSHMRRIGILPVDLAGNPTYRVGITADPVSRSDDDENQGGIRGVFPSLDSQDFLTIVPSLAVDFLKEHGDSTQVANPHLRVTSGETGSVSIGQQIPVAQTSFTNAQLSGSAGGANNFGDSALTSFQYDDVGIKIQVTPRVHYNNEITLDLELEVSSVIIGGLQPTFGKREVKTSIRLKNGETNVLAGLLTNDERKSLLGIPGLSDIPLLGRLFSNDEKVINQTDIILTTRPVIIRSPNVTKQDRAPYELSALRLSSLYGPEKEVDAGEAIEAIELEPIPGAAGPAPMEPAQPIPFDPNGTLAPTDTAEEEDASLFEDAPAPAMLAFTPPNQEGRQDDILEYQIFITNVEGMQRGEIVMEFDAEVLQASAVEMGEFFGNYTNKPLLTPAWDNRNGRLTLIITQRLSTDPFSGSGILATLRFRAKAPGEGNLNFATILLTNRDKQEIPADGLPGSYEVSP